MYITISQPGKEELTRLNVFTWDIWTSEPARFTWNYSNRETCFILEGKATVTTDEQTLCIGPGDLVVFPSGLSCEWEVHETVRKHFIID